MRPDEQQDPRDETSATSGHEIHPGMTADEFRHFGREIIDWIADYYATVEKYPVRSQVKPGEIRDLLPGSPPDEPEPFERILADVDRVVMPGITHWQSPNFYGYFPANTSYPSILGELLSAGLGVQGMSWSTSPACTELETQMLDWFIDLLGLPESFRSTGSGGGVIQDSASSATLCAMLAARDRHQRGANTTTDSAGVLTAYASEDAHSSVSKAAGIAGIGRENLRTIACTADRTMDVTDLRNQILADRQAGRQPFFVCAFAGTTSTLAFDPLEEIGSICKEFGLWLHVDGAMAGSAAVCPEFRWVRAGVELADSYCFNPHKWLLTNFDCDCFYVKDRNDLLEALSILPEYLRNSATDSGLVIDYRDWQIPLGRRFRALKLWFTLRAYGARGLREHIRRHVAIAGALREWIAADSDFEIVGTPRLNLICFRHRGGDELNRRAMERVNSTGRMFMTHTSVDGRFVLRLCVGQSNTTLDHVRASWELLASTFHSLA